MEDQADQAKLNMAAAAETPPGEVVIFSPEEGPVPVETLQNLLGETWERVQKELDGKAEVTGTRLGYFLTKGEGDIQREYAIENGEPPELPKEDEAEGDGDETEEVGILSYEFVNTLTDEIEQQMLNDPNLGDLQGYGLIAFYVSTIRHSSGRLLNAGLYNCCFNQGRRRKWCNLGAGWKCSCRCR